MSLVFFNGCDTIYTDSIMVIDDRVSLTSKSFAFNEHRHLAFAGDMEVARDLIEAIAHEGAVSIAKIRRLTIPQGCDTTVILVDYRSALQCVWHASTHRPMTGDLRPFAPFITGYGPAVYALRYATRSGTADPESLRDLEELAFRDVVEYHQEAEADASVKGPILALCHRDTVPTVRGKHGWHGVSELPPNIKREYDVMLGVVEEAQLHT